MRRVTLNSLVLAILVTLFAGALLASPATAASATITISRSSVIGGESVRVSGALGTRGVRPVRLQRRTGTSWATIQRAKSTARGRYAFAVRPTGAAGTRNVYRVLAPRVRINGRVRAAVATPSRTVTVVAQTAVLTGPARVTIDKPFTMTATLRPVRPGRVTILQRFSAGVWTEIKRGVQSAAGTTSFAVTPSSLGSQSLRAVAAPSGGAPAKISNTFPVKVLPPAMQRASESATGTQADSASFAPVVDGDGRYTAFLSSATNLVPNDTNGKLDVFVRDLETLAVERVSVSSGGVQANNDSLAVAISADGRYVAFSSFATNLVAGNPCGGVGCVYLHDRETGATELVSITTSGTPTAASYHPSVSADGSKVAFASGASNLVANDTNAKADIFVRDRTAGTTTRISVDSDGGQSDGASDFPKISANGVYVTYESVATDLVPNDTEGKQDVFLWSEETHTVLPVSERPDAVGGNGDSGAPEISADGRYVTYSSLASNLVGGDTNGVGDLFRWDRFTNQNLLVSLTDADSQLVADFWTPTISANGRYVAFAARGFPVAPGETASTFDIFVRDVTAGTTRRISQTASGTNGDADSSFPSISGNGITVAFASLATNLVPSDTNGAQDAFARDLTR